MDIQQLINPKRTPCAIVIIVAEVVCIAIRWWFSSRVKGSNIKKAYTGFFDDLYVKFYHALFNGVPIAYAISPIFDWANYSVQIPEEIMAAVGGAVLALGIYIFYLSHSDLGVLWAPTLKVRPGHKLVTKGIYSLVRHPMYLCADVLAIGKVIVCHNWLCAIGAILPNITHLFLRIPQEERMMIEEFGDEYRRYMQRVGRLFPKLW